MEPRRLDSETWSSPYLPGDAASTPRPGPFLGYSKQRKKFRSSAGPRASRRDELRDQTWAGRGRSRAGPGRGFSVGGASWSSGVESLRCLGRSRDAAATPKSEPGLGMGTSGGLREWWGPRRHWSRGGGREVGKGEGPTPKEPRKQPNPSLIPPPRRCLRGVLFRSPRQGSSSFSYSLR